MKAPVLFVLACICASVLGAGCVEQPGGDAATRAAGYLLAHQNPDGGFPATAGGPSDFATTAWVTIAAAHEIPAGAKGSLVNYLARQSGAVENGSTGSLSRVNPISLYILAGLSVGDTAAAWNRTDPVQDLRAYVDNASLYVTERIMMLGVFARANDPAATRLADEIRLNMANASSADLQADPWGRAYAILALIAFGDPAGQDPIRSWARDLLDFQKDDLGFQVSPEYEPDSSTTSAILAVLWQVPFVYSHEKIGATQFLEDQQQKGGRVRFSATNNDYAPMKTTAEAVLGWSGRGPFKA